MSESGGRYRYISEKNGGRMDFHWPQVFAKFASADRHKAALANRIREASMKTRKDELAQAKMNATLAQMEAAAAASMMAHGEALTHGPSLPTTGLKMNIFDPKQHKDIGSMAQEMAARRDGAAKRKGLSGAAPGMVGPTPKVTKEDVASAYRDLTNPAAAGPALPASHVIQHLPQQQTQTGEISWVQAKDQNGRTYYWNIFDETTRWEQPSYFYSAAQYEKKVKEFEEARDKYYYGTDEVKAVRQGKKSLEKYIQSKIAESGMESTVENNREELGLNKKKKEKMKAWEKKKAEREKRWKQRQGKEEQDQEEPTEEGSPQNEDLDSSSMGEIPLPPSEGTSSSDTFSHLPELPNGDSEYSNEVQPEAVKTEIESFPPPPDFTKPYDPRGGWVRITAAEKNDGPFESPLTARYRELEEQQKKEEEQRQKEQLNEPKIEFEEKTAVTMTKKVKGPIEFKKKTTTRNIRKREED
ncbi:unnamed protein product [Caenorhabditis auriculariae]|uniref:WW domain-containing protein n=1 Tax=Caenorhabditis auriculariae TaxID=2777116 RepID=A0A8S1HHV8_9PELO|nr:unnamed protein product [Caenorhabditis auriculariae]